MMGRGVRRGSIFREEEDYRLFMFLLEQMRTIDKKRLGEKMGHLDEETMTAVDNAISVSLGLGGVRAE